MGHGVGYFIEAILPLLLLLLFNGMVVPVVVEATFINHKIKINY